ncbi:MAG: hypothetical protein ACLRYE_08370 [Gemmiger formicilis]|uniref:hypothetical protein n=1 Tax=Gemmiger formicilis TaxID=745368 RepID=UPI0039A11417
MRHGERGCWGTPSQIRMAYGAGKSYSFDSLELVHIFHQAGSGIKAYLADPWTAASARCCRACAWRH